MHARTIARLAVIWCVLFLHSPAFGHRGQVRKQRKTQQVYKAQRSKKQFASNRRKASVPLAWKGKKSAELVQPIHANKVQTTKERRRESRKKRLNKFYRKAAHRLGQPGRWIARQPAFKGVRAKVISQRRRLTRQLDSWQASAPPVLGKTLKAIRTYGLGSVAAFTTSLIRTDAKFLTIFFAANNLMGKVALPAAVVAGAPAAVIGVWMFASTPFQFATVIARHQYLQRKAGNPLSFGESARNIFRDYQKLAKQRLRNVQQKAAQAAPENAAQTSP